MPVSEIFCGNGLELLIDLRETSYVNAVHCLRIRRPVIRGVHGWQDSPLDA